MASTRIPPASGNALSAAVTDFCTPRTVRVPTALPTSVSACLVSATRLSSVNWISGNSMVCMAWCIITSRIASPVTNASP